MNPSPVAQFMPTSKTTKYEHPLLAGEWVVLSQAKERGRSDVTVIMQRPSDHKNAEAFWPDDFGPHDWHEVIE